MSPDLLSVIVRTAGYVFVLQAAGAVLFLLQFRAGLDASRGSVRMLGIAAALLAMPCIVAHLLLEAARMAGEYQGMTDPELLRLAVQSGSGGARALQLAGLALIATGLRRDSALPVAAAVGAALAILAFPLTGHTSVHALRALLAPLLALHVALVAYWLGALAPLLLALRRESRPAAVDLLRRFSASAGWLVPFIPAAGIAMALVLMPDAAAWLRPYGLLLVAKLAIYGLLMGLAALNRWRWVPMLATDGMRGRLALQRTVVFEYVLVASVLALTATLTTFYSPEH